MTSQATSGYNRRALVEAEVSRFKRVIGDALSSRIDRRRTTEVAIAVGMLNLRRPEYVMTSLTPRRARERRKSVQKVSCVDGPLAGKENLGVQAAVVACSRVSGLSDAAHGRWP